MRSAYVDGGSGAGGAQCAASWTTENSALVPASDAREASCRYTGYPVGYTVASQYDLSRGDQAFSKSGFFSRPQASLMISSHSSISPVRASVSQSGCAYVCMLFRSAALA